MLTKEGMYSPLRPFSSTTRPCCLFQQVLLVLFGKDVSEIRTVKFGFLTDTVDAQYDGTSHGLLE